MPNPENQNFAVAALVLDLNADTSAYPAGCNAHLFPDGAFRAGDGRPASLTGGEVRDWQMDAAIAAALIALFESGGKPILYDYEHNSLYGDSRAAGWIDKLVYVPDQGMFAHVDWTPRAAEDIANKVLCYSSPYFYFDTKTGAVIQLISVALTNNPALGDLGAVGLKRKGNFHQTAATEKEAPMGDKELAALTAERDGLKTQLTAMTAERDGLKTQLTAVTTERDGLKTQQADAALKVEQDQKDALIATACGGDKPLMTPAQAEAVKGLGLADLTKFIDTLKPVPLTQRQSDRSEGEHGLDEAALAWCNKMGVSPEQYKEAKKSLG